MIPSCKNLKLISGNTYSELTLLISKYLNIKVCHNICLQLKNMQLVVTLGENVKNDNVFIMQTMSDNCERLNDILLELLQLASVCKSGDASSITAGSY